MISATTHAGFAELSDYLLERCKFLEKKAVQGSKYGSKLSKRSVIHQKEVPKGGCCGGGGGSTTANPKNESKKSRQFLRRFIHKVISHGYEIIYHSKIASISFTV